jgi:hypothetical protein
VPTYQERISQRIANYMANPPAKQAISDAEGKPTTNIRKIFEDLKVTG